MQGTDVLLISSAEFHYRRDRVAALPTLNNHLATTATLHRTVREIDPFKIVEQFISDIALFPGRAFQQFLHFIQSILASIRSAFRLVFDSIESVIDRVFERGNGTSPSTEERRRRSSNDSSPLPDLILNPLNNVRKILHQIESTTSAEIGTIVETIVRTAWNFFITEVLPSLHRILERLENSNVLPSSLQNLIQSLEAMYFLMRMAGYVSWFFTVWRKPNNFDSRRLVAILASFLSLEFVEIAEYSYSNLLCFQWLLNIYVYIQAFRFYRDFSCRIIVSSFPINCVKYLDRISKNWLIIEGGIIWK